MIVRSKIVKLPSAATTQPSVLPLTVAPTNNKCNDISLRKRCSSSAIMVTNAEAVVEEEKEH